MGVKIHYDNKEKFYDFSPIPAPEKIGGESGVPIEVAELPEATADTVGKVYLTTTDGEYYVGVGGGTLTVGEFVPPIIKYDKSIVPEIVGNEAYNGIAAFLLAGDGGIIGYPEDSIGVEMIGYTSEPNHIRPLYVNSTSMSVEDFNANLGAEFGISITEFGWQGDGTINTGVLSGATIDIFNDPQGIFSTEPDFSSLVNSAFVTSIIMGNINEISSNATILRHSIFRDCKNLTTVDFPNATSIGSEAFYNTRVTTVDFPNVTSIGNKAFMNCHKLTTANFPNATSIGSEAFDNCPELTTVDFPNATSIGSEAFYNTRVTTVDFPNVTSIENKAFTVCTDLTTVDFPNATSIGSEAFSYCGVLTTVIIGTNQTSVATLSNTNAFAECYHILGTTHNIRNPKGAKDGYIYVPAALAADYRVAENWSTYASQIMPYVTTVDELANIDGTTYDKACVGTDYTEYTFNGTEWEVYR